MTRRTKIVATIGPASADPVALEKLISAGADVCRLNLSHGPLEEHLGRLATSCATSRADARPPRRGDGRPARPEDPRRIVLRRAASTSPATAHRRLVAGEGQSTAEQISVDYPDLLTHVDVGERVVLGDGEISLRVVDKAADALVAEVESGGRTQGRPGVHLACERLALARSDRR